MNAEPTRWVHYRNAVGLDRHLVADRLGDLGSDLSVDHNPTQRSLTVWLPRDLMERFQAMAAARGPRQTTALAREILTQAIEAQEQS